MEKTNKIPANQNEIMLYCQLGEALMKIQMAEQALSYMSKILARLQLQEQGIRTYE